jgi:hypothetical protein
MLSDLTTIIKPEAPYSQGDEARLTRFLT